MLNSPRVLVTGAAGFVGWHVCAYLARMGRSVRGLVRRESANLPEGVERTQLGDLSDVEGMPMALHGVGAVVHCAARVHVTDEAAADPLAAFRQVNVGGTVDLLEAASSAGVSQFVFLSSVKAVGEASTQPWDESVLPAPVDPYGISKYEAEARLMAQPPSSPMAISILRLPLVYGPGVSANMMRLIRTVDRGVPLPFRGIDNRRSLAFVGNVCLAVEAVLDRPSGSREVFFVSDDEDVSTPGLIKAIAYALGRPARLFPMPWLMLRPLARMGDRISTVVPWPLSTMTLQRLTGSLQVDCGKLQQHTNYRPRYRLAQGLASTVTWYRAQRPH